jgi:TonB family protein
LTDARDAAQRKDLGLALAFSAGLHLAAAMTLDLVPGDWRHGLQPAFQVRLRPAPGAFGIAEAAAAEVTPSAHSKGGLAASKAQSGSSVPMAERYYRSSEVDQQAVPVVHGPLIFPEQAYVSKLAGTVRARVYIDERGNVVSVKIVEARPLRGVFEDAALEALSQVRYRPALLGGQPVKSQKLIEVSFNPYEERAPAAK